MRRETRRNAPPVRLRSRFREAVPVGVHHIALGAADVETLSAFYRDVVGLDEVSRRDDDEGNLRSVWLRLSSEGVLMIERTDDADEPRSSALHPLGMFLIAFDAGDDETHAAICQRLSDAGIEEISRTEYTQYFRDPEGNRFALSRYPLRGNVS